MISNHIVSKTRNERKATRLIFRVETINQIEHIIWLERGATLQTNWVFNTPTELNMGMIQLARTVADPNHMT